MKDVDICYLNWLFDEVGVDKDPSMVGAEWNGEGVGSSRHRYNEESPEPAADNYRQVTRC